MTRPTDLATAWDAYVADRAIAARHVSPAVQARRDFYAGAMALQALRQEGVSESALLSELRQFGRAIGTAAEAA